MDIAFSFPVSLLFESTLLVFFFNLSLTITHSSVFFSFSPAAPRKPGVSVRMSRIALLRLSTSV